METGEVWCFGQGLPLVELTATENSHIFVNARLFNLAPMYRVRWDLVPKCQVDHPAVPPLAPPRTP